MGFVFFFSSRRRHTRSDRDWSSDVCSSDLRKPGPAAKRKHRRTGAFLLVMAVCVAGIGAAGAAVYVARARGGGADPAALVVAGIPGSRSIALLEQDRQRLILMDA